MAKVLDELVQQLGLERIEQNLFRGQSQDLGWGTVFGGQVLGQALSAAVQTVPEERQVHSLHAYFLRPGDVSKPIVYDVDRIRDGSSFTTRRVVAIQSGRPIFNLAASFQKREPGFEHHDPMPAVPAPDESETERDHYARFGERAPHWHLVDVEERPFELRLIDPPDDPIYPTPQRAARKVWMRATGKLPETPALHAYLLAYVSDFAFITTALLPHGVTGNAPGMQVASLDHVMWFHHPLRVDEWLLYVMDSPAASGARGLVRGAVYSQDGRLVASTAQEGLIRMRKPEQ
jgi:acyl-CoA thioesterase-2